MGKRGLGDGTSERISCSIRIKEQQNREYVSIMGTRFVL